MVGWGSVNRLQACGGEYVGGVSPLRGLVTLVHIFPTASRLLGLDTD